MLSPFFQEGGRLYENGGCTGSYRVNGQFCWPCAEKQEKPSCYSHFVWYCLRSPRAWNTRLREMRLHVGGGAPNKRIVDINRAIFLNQTQ